jgi:peptidoglycan LD-endopeptidase CwlK
MDVKSKARLATCCYDLVRLFTEVDKYYPCNISEGRRSPSRQDELFDEGKSKLKGDDPKAMHCYDPSRALDAQPIPIDWNNTKRFYYFSGFVMGVAAAMGISLRCGADWDGDGETNDQEFNDVNHFELKEE